jgi:hypothetical protein
MDLMNSVRIVSAYGKDFLPDVDSFPAIIRQDAATRLLIAEELMRDVQALPAVERILRGIEDDNSVDAAIKGGARNRLCLCFIAQEKYDNAMATISEKRSRVEEINDIRNAFNYAMAEWGKTGTPPRDLFSRVIELSKSENEQSANYLQCMAIANFVIGDRDQAHEYVNRALREIRVNPRMVFSSWRYLEAIPAEFRQDLEAIKTMIEGREVTPLFIGRNTDLFSNIH